MVLSGRLLSLFHSEPQVAQRSMNERQNHNLFFRNSVNQTIRSHEQFSDRFTIEFWNNLASFGKVRE